MTPTMSTKITFRLLLWWNKAFFVTLVDWSLFLALNSSTTWPLSPILPLQRRRIPAAKSWCWWSSQNSVEQHLSSYIIRTNWWRWFDYTTTIVLHIIELGWHFHWCTVVRTFKKWLCRMEPCKCLVFVAPSMSGHYNNWIYGSQTLQKATCFPSNIPLGICAGMCSSYNAGVECWWWCWNFNTPRRRNWISR